MIKVLTNKKPVSKTSFFFHFLTLECLLSIQFALNRPLRATAREKNIAGVTHQASQLTELEPVIPGRTTATFRSFEPESGVPSQICSCRSCRYNPRSDRNSRPSWHRNLTNPWWSMTPLTFAAHLIVQGGATILISLAHMHSESPAFPEDNRFELAWWRYPADWWSSA